MKISDASIRNPVFAWMLMVGLILFGAISFSRMGVSQMPDVDFPVLNVSLTLEGAAPEVMESTVVDFVEDAVMSVEGLKSINSKSKTGSANVTLEFDLSKDIDVALQEVQTKVAQAQRFLPTDLEPPVITKSNPEDQPIIWLALTYDKGDTAFMMKYAYEQLKDRFTTVPGVGEIFLGGYVAPALRVWVNPNELRRRNIAVNDIIDAIKTEHSELPGGLIEETSKAFNVRTLGEAKTVEEFSSIPISKRAGQTVADPSNMLRMKQVARVEEGLDEIRRLSRFNGIPSLGLGVRKQRGANAVEVAHSVKEKVNEIAKDLPEGMKLQVNFDSTRFIEYSIRELNHHLILAVILTSLVCWAFLGSWTATLNVLLSIPTSIMGAFIGMYFLGFTLNTFTLLGLTLAIGLVVDDAIMVLENIFRYQEMKKGKIEAAIIGTREIAFAALAATAAVVAIFLPVVFMKGIIGKYFLQFGITISFAVLLSLLEALTITPMRASAFVGSHERTSLIGRGFEAGMKGLERVYTGTLRTALRWRWTTVFVAVLFMTGSFYLVKFVPKEFSPAQDQSLFMVRFQTPVGSSLAYTDEKIKLAEEWLMKQPVVKQIYVALGGFGGGGGEGNTAMMFVTMIPKAERTQSQQQFMNVVRQELGKIPDLTSRLQDLSQRGFGGGRGFPVEFILTGGNWDVLWDSTQKIMQEMEKSGMMVDVDSDYLLGMPEIQVTPDRVRAALHGVSVQSIGSTINSLVGGVRVGQYQKDGRRYDIRLKLEEDKNKKTDISQLLIGNSRSNLIPLSQVVNIDTKKSLQQISRVDRQRAITVYANLAPGATQQAALDFVQAKAHEVLPDGYHFGSQGSSQTMKESFESLLVALVLGFAVAYMVLAAQFNSFLDPVTILMALPFAIGGALFALLATFQSLNIYSMIGILLLMGIAKKNSIMLIEFTNQKRHQGFTKALDALMEACPIRLRPILMTSLATVTAAIPSAVATGEGSETFKPMAITIIGGVALSTLLTLYVVPAVYLLFDRLRRSEDSHRDIEAAFKAVDGH
ncbi:MAG TPA: efflux RND transporter permease subunit [Pseudobdellovibrionaceae bacterium]|nr:efflux RND transporter permease subunit [Pseudobdellovibrionaceae bacterium]